MKERERNRTKEEIFRILMVLEKNNMNQSKTSRELGLNRQLLIRYINKHYEEYRKNRIAVKAQALEIAKEKQVILTEMNDFKEGLSKLQNAAIEKLVDYLATSQKKEPRLWINIIDTLSPYLVEKMDIAGVNPLNDLDPVTRHTTFVQNIINKMQITNGNNVH